MKIKFLLLLIFAVLIGGLLVPKFFIQDSRVLSTEDIVCAKTETHLMLDNPFERALVQKLAVSGKDGENLYVDAYAFWGIKYARVRVVCNKNAEVIWRLGSKQIINSFEECATAGYPIMESYPRQCRTPDSRIFVETVTDIPTPPDGSGVVCTMEVKQCPDGSYVGRVSPSCEFAPCPK